MRRKALYGLLAFGAYGIFLLVTAPARVVLPKFILGLPAFIRVAHIHGTIWDGRLTLLVSTGAGADPLSRVRFRFTPWTLIEGRAGYDLHLNGTVQGHMRVAFGSKGQAFSDLALTMPAGTLAAWVPAAQNFGPGGHLALHARKLVWGPHPSGQGALTWSQAALVGAPVNPLGSYVSRFVLANQALSYHIHTLTGPLRVTGRGRCHLARGVLSFSGDVHGRGLRLGGLIQNIGVPDGRGGRRIHFRMPL